MRVPPKWVRRPIAYLTIYLLFAITVLASPVLVIAAVIASYRMPGRWRALRLFGFAMTGLFVEAVAVLVAGILWLASGCGFALRSPRFQRAHYAVLRWALATLIASAKRLFHLEVEIEGPDPASEAALPPDRPMLVLCRHAGPGDSLLVMDALLSQARRRPRVVLKDTMQLDPTVDLYLNRLPAKFVNPNPGEGENMTDGIAALARDMGRDDALLIFPEGGNFTPKRRERAIRRLREAGRTEAAELAMSMRHVLPPRPAGVSAALDAAPTADAVFVAHTGLDHMATVADIWAELPQDKVLRSRWRVDAAEGIGRTEDERVRWLNEHWIDLDEWIDAKNA
ncbi:1-acyl-sn-glycerol-3-phosphate acyltransferase [Cumulibacter soli]|uniref:1-acyl-sn-glycerol-3-phosphate acyltransferase n=1 Tax=Cumulibacter soli TaxID=2546344 RepID=UPI00106749C0|nr:1-acyl-sn-glycerol-3-phosphate acyltransferase [Cumulibacter soli]